MASSEKHRLEEAQRARKKLMDKEGKHHQARYFEEKYIEETKETIYVQNGKYWEDRVNKNWDHLTRIFE